MNLVIARALTARNERIDAETENFVVASSDAASAGHHGHSSPRGDGSDNLVYTVTKASDPLWTEGVAQPITNRNDDPGVISTSTGVRRLTPLECERLMGYPDNWTRWDADGREISDSHRYRMCGNGVVSTVAEWLAHRLAWVDQLTAEAVA